MKTYKKLPRSFGMQLLSFAPKHTQMFMLVNNFHRVVCTDNVYAYIAKNPHVLSVQFFTRTMEQSFELPMIYISFDRFPLGIQEFLKKLLTE